MRGINRKTKILDVTNYKNSVNFVCKECGYVCHGEKGGRLHLKYSHGVKKKDIITEQFCVRCNKIFYESVSKHMIQHREEI